MEQRVKPKIRFNQEAVGQMNGMLHDLKLNTVCAEATCPNLGECFSSDFYDFG